MTGPQTIRDLSTHTAPYVSVRMLARYWHVDRRVVDKWVTCGLLPATVFPGGLRRVRRDDALAFELVHRLVPCDRAAS